jgi:regulator of protease activity HflC (stomatin/prohibitin superfamily)
MIKERVVHPIPGLAALIVCLAGLIGSIVFFIRGAGAQDVRVVLASAAVFVVLLFLATGIFVVNPNEAKVLTLFGRYLGTAKEPGLWLANPFALKKKVSLRVRNFETQKLKVNDNHSNPIDIAAVVVWQVIDTAEALFEVDDFENYVKVQSESAVRALASQYPYDAHEPNQPALSTHTAEVAHELIQQVQERLGKAGVQVLEARISHLAYSPEIASSMLQRQQATAIIAARQKIVEGAVGMVEQALDMLSQRKIVELDDERRATMVSNLLVVLCSERSTQPVVNAGTLYT